MNVLLFGASGDVGRRIAAELLERGHEVTGVSRTGSIDGIEALNAGSVSDSNANSASDSDSDSDSNANFRIAEGDATDPDDVASLAGGHDAVVSAVGPAGGDPDVVPEAARGLVGGLREAGVSRLIVVGGGGTLEVEPGVDLVDTPEFPDAVRPVSLAHRDALGVLQEAADDLEWTFFAPPGILEPGERTGEFRIGEDQLLTDEEGDSRISMEDYAVALVDELEEGKAIRGRLTAAY